MVWGVWCGAVGPFVNPCYPTRNQSQPGIPEMSKTLEDPVRLQLAVNAALNHASILSENFRQAIACGMGADNKRAHAWSDYGWPESVGFNEFFKLWDRQGVAYGVVNRMTDKCFETHPWVIQGDEFEEEKKETDWDREFKRFARRSDLWAAIHEADRRRLVGGFAALLIQVKDGKNWSEPITDRRGVVKSFIPAWAGQLTPCEFDNDVESETYGEPTYWEFKEGATTVGGVAALSPRDLKVHPDRIMLIGDWRTGRSYLRAAYNSFVNLEKIEGGSGEGFLKNASNRMAINYDPAANLQSIASQHGLKSVHALRQAMNDAAADLNSGVDRLLITQGATVTPLVGMVPDPQPHYSVSIQTISASTGQPAKVIVGMQTGERASTEDLKDFNKLGQGRRTGPLSRDIKHVVEHLQRTHLVSAVPGEDFTVMWDDLTESTQGEKLDNADKMAGINQKNMGGGDAPVFSAAQIRETADWEGEPDDSDLPPLKKPVLPDVEPKGAV